jgi:hypothetical protein
MDEREVPRSDAGHYASPTSSFFVRRSYAVSEEDTNFPPLAKGGLRGVDAAEPHAGTVSVFADPSRTGQNVPSRPPPLTPPSQREENGEELTSLFLSAGAHSSKAMSAIHSADHVNESSLDEPRTRPRPREEERDRGEAEHDDPPEDCDANLELCVVQRAQNQRDREGQRHER